MFLGGVRKVLGSIRQSLTQIFLATCSLWVLFLTMPTPVSASSLEAYKSVVQQLGRMFWSDVQVKMALMIVNYVPRVHPHGVTYLSREQIGCNLKSYSAASGPSQLEEVAQLQVHRSVAERERRETTTVQYIGCASTPLFTEFIQRQGVGLSPLALEDIISGNREFVLQEGESWRSITLEDSEGVPFISILSRKTNRGQETLFQHNQQVLVRIVWDEIVKSLLIMTPENYIDYSSERFSINGNIYFGGAEIILEARQQEGLVYPRYFYRSRETQEMTQSDFNRHIDEVPGSVIKFVYSHVLNGILENHWPSTDLVSGAVASRRIIEELTLIVNRLKSASPQDIDLASAQLRDLISSILTGEVTVIDNRKD